MPPTHKTRETIIAMYAKQGRQHPLRAEMRAKVSKYMGGLTGEQLDALLGLILEVQRERARARR